MCAVIDTELLEQCRRALAPNSDAPTQAAHAATNGQSQRAGSLLHVTAAPHSALADEATVPIGEEEYSPRTRQFASMSRAARPADKQQLEVWRAGHADVSPASKAATEDQLRPVSAREALTDTAPHAQTVTDPAATPHIASDSQPQSAASRVLAPLPPAQSNASPPAAAVPRLSLLQALLRGRI